jgi:hypothetical protein
VRRDVDILSIRRLAFVNEYLINGISRNAMGDDSLEFKIFIPSIFVRSNHFKLNFYGRLEICLYWILSRIISKYSAQPNA